MNPLVSVVIPCYNVEAYIDASLESVLTQGHAPLEIICIDDGSDDQTYAILEAFKNGRFPEMILRKQDNLGAHAARNLGLELSKGEYIQFLDADDILGPQKIAEQIAIALANEKPDLIIGSFERHNEHGKLLEVVKAQSGINKWQLLMEQGLGITSANLWKKSSVHAAGDWNLKQRSSQEYELMFRMIQQSNSRIAIDPILNTIVHRRKSGSISHSNRQQNWLNYVNLRIQILHYVKANIAGLEMDPFYQFLFNSIRILFRHNAETAVQIYNAEIPNNFKPKPFTLSNRFYLFLVKLLGFEKAEKLKIRFGTTE